MYLTEKASQFKEYVGWLALKSKVKKEYGFVKLRVDWHCKGNGAGDLDNKLKIIQDSLNGIAYQDDKQVIQIEAKKIMHSNFDGAIVEVKKL